MDKSIPTTGSKRFTARLLRLLSRATCILATGTLLVIAAPSHAQTVSLADAPEMATTDINLSTAPRIAAENFLVEENYVTPALTREQAAIDHASQQPPITSRLRHLHGNDTLVVETGVQLSRDRDHDGYYSAFSLEMDVDTRDQLEVYANIFLQQSYQYPQLLHSTRSFHLYGNSTSDEYRIDVTLTDDFPAGHYDLIIEIRDAWSDQLLDVVGEADFQNLGGLPLEDESHYSPRDDGDSVVVEYAGASAPVGLLILALFYSTLRRRNAVPT